ncbi:MAG: hypothetical protein ACYCT0_11695 [Sulfobacillus sp.]
MEMDPIYDKRYELQLLTEEEVDSLNPYMREYLSYRKSGLSLNHIIGCPINCGYCVRHFWGNFDDKTPNMLCSDDQAVEALTSSPYFIPDRTPIQMFNKATDPFLPAVKPHTFAVLRKLNDRGYHNFVILITRFRVTEKDMAFLETLENIRLSLFFTYSAIKDRRIEPISASGITLKSIRTAASNHDRVKVILYWRPIVPGWNDDEETMQKVLGASVGCDAIVYSGYYHRPENAEYLKTLGVPLPYAEPQRRKVLPQDLDSRIVDMHRRSGVRTPLFRKTSCGVAFAFRAPDYNGHWGVREICDTCPVSQQKICADAYTPPEDEDFAELLAHYGYVSPFMVQDGHVWTSDLGEQRRYHLQHTLGFQVWDIDSPHFKNNHGRSPTSITLTDELRSWYEEQREEFYQAVVKDDD